MQLTKVKLNASIIYEGEVKESGEVIQCLPEFARYITAVGQGEYVKEKKQNEEVVLKNVEPEVVTNKEEYLKLTKRKTK